MNPIDRPEADPAALLEAVRRNQREIVRQATWCAEQYSQARSGLVAAVTRATRAEAYLEPFVRSRVQRAMWRLGLAVRPAWVGEYERREALPSTALPSNSEVAAASGEIDRLSQEVVAQMAGLAAESPESQMDAALQHLVDKGFHPGVILDVGSAKGYWSERTGWLHFKDAEYYMIDPLDESQEHLGELARRSPKYHPLQLAIGSAPGEMVMSVTADGDGSSLLAFPNSPAIARRTVPVETLDRLLADGRIAMPDLVKIDVQGFELEVLRGASRLLGTADVFVIEVNLFRFVADCPLAHEVVAFMADRGYRLYDLAGQLRRPFQNDLGQMDLVFVRNESPLVASNRWM